MPLGITGTYGAHGVERINAAGLFVRDFRFFPFRPRLFLRLRRRRRRRGCGRRRPRRGGDRARRYHPPHVIAARSLFPPSSSSPSSSPPRFHLFLLATVLDVGARGDDVVQAHTPPAPLLPPPAAHGPSSSRLRDVTSFLFLSLFHAECGTARVLCVPCVRSCVHACVVRAYVRVCVRACVRPSN